MLAGQMGIRRERFDRGELLAPPYETPEGFLVVEAFVSRPGIYVYRNTREDELDGLGKEGELRRELRPDSEVTAPKSLESYRARSVTIGHPRKNGKRVRVDATNVREFEVGTVDGPARVIDGRLAAKLVIKDKAAIAAAKAGKRRISPGHFPEIIVHKGVDPKYGPYDAIQTDIEINHVALVEHARGGDSLQLRLDGEEIREDELDGKLTTVVRGHAHLVRMTDYDGKTCSSGTTSWAVSEGEEQPHEHAWIRNSDGSVTIAPSAGHTHELVREPSILALAGAAFDAALNPSSVAPMRTDGFHSFRSDGMSEDNKNEQNEIEKLRAENETLQKRITELEGQVKLRLDAAEQEAVKKERMRADEAEQKLAAHIASRKAAIQARVALLRTAEQFLGSTYRCDAKDDEDIKRDIVRRLDPTLDVSSLSSARLDGHFEALVKLHAKAREDHADLSRALGGGGGNRRDEQAAKAKLDEEWNNAWKRPAASSQMLRKEH